MQIKIFILINHLIDLIDLVVMMANNEKILYLKYSTVIFNNNNIYAYFY